MSGRSQQVKINRGVDKGSVAMYGLEVDQLVSMGSLIQVRLSNAIIKLCVVVYVHSHLGVESQIVGNSMMVGIRIFSIVVSLGLVGDLFHGSGLWQLVKLILHWLHRLRRLAGRWGLRKRWLILVGGFRWQGQ